MIRQNISAQHILVGRFVIFDPTQYAAVPTEIIETMCGGHWMKTTKYRHTAIPVNHVAYLCDTADEAEKMRLLIEKRREELEAVERKYELLIAAEVTQ